MRASKLSNCALRSSSADARDLIKDSNSAYDSSTGIWTVGTVSNGASVSVQITATVLASGNYTNYAQVQTVNERDPNSTPGDDSTTQDDDDSVTLNPTSVADLSLSKTVNTTTPNVGTNVVYTITVSNAGPSGATGATGCAATLEALVRISGRPDN